MNNPEAAARAETKVWDPLVRIFHWSLVAVFGAAWLTGDDESRLHEISGYAVLGLVAFRIFWGFVGTRHTRFSDFIYSPSAMFAYARDLLASKPKRYMGHNPLGGAMVVVFLVSLLGAGLTGLALRSAEEGDSVLASPINVVSAARADEDEDERGRENEEAGEAWEDVHEFFAQLTLWLVALHIVGVVVSSLAHRENLVRAMITGRKHE